MSARVLVKHTAKISELSLTSTKSLEYGGFGLRLGDGCLLKVAQSSSVGCRMRLQCLELLNKIRGAGECLDCLRIE